MSQASNPEYQDYYAYLDRLRESGVTNMLGVGPYLQSEFDLDKVTARKILVSWMKEFSA